VKKTIYFIINDVSIAGGLSRVTLNLYDELKKLSKYNVKIISASISTNEFNDNNQDIINLGLVSPHKLSKFNKLWWYLKFIYKINLFLKDKNPDIVIGIGVLFNLCLSLYISKSYKVYGAEHSYYGNNNKLIIKMRKLLYKRLDKIISLTKVDELKYKQFHNDIVTIPNFTNFYNNINTSTQKNKNLLYLGRFTKIKGVDILIDLMKDFFTKYPDWTLTMRGEGPLKNEIINKITEYQLSENITIQEATNDVEKEYLQSDIYLMTSRSEAFPMVLLEAQTFGLPIVSYDCNTGPSEIINDNKDGFLVPMGNDKLFLNKLELLVNNYELRKKMGQQAVANVKKFYPNNIMKEWEEILDEKIN